MSLSDPQSAPLVTLAELRQTLGYALEALDAGENGIARPIVADAVTMVRELETQEEDRA